MSGLIPSNGKLLTVEQSRRLDMLDKRSRQQQIELIARHLRAVSQGRWQSASGPRQWYARLVL